MRILSTHSACVCVQWMSDMRYIHISENFTSVGLTHAHPNYAMLHCSWNLYSSNYVCLTVPKWQCVSAELSFIVLEHERNSVSEASWNEPNKFWSNEKTRSTAAEDDCTSKIFSAVAGKSLACFFWRGSAFFSKSIADYSLGCVIGWFLWCMQMLNQWWTDWTGWWQWWAGCTG